MTEDKGLAALIQVGKDQWSETQQLSCTLTMYLLLSPCKLDVNSLVVLVWPFAYTQELHPINLK